MGLAETIATAIAASSRTIARHASLHRDFDTPSSPRSQSAASTTAGEALLDRVGVGALRQRLLADGAERHLKEILQHAVALPVVGQAVKGFDELLSKVRKRRHAWSFLPARRGAGSSAERARGLVLGYKVLHRL